MLEELRETDETLVTHNYVVVESAALVQRRLGPSALRPLLDDLVPLLDVVWVDPDVHRVAVAALLAAQERRDVSLVDRVSFELMRRRRIDTAFAFDRHFEREGYALVPQ